LRRLPAVLPSQPRTRRTRRVHAPRTRLRGELASGRNKCDLDDRLIATLLGDYRRHGFGYVDYTAQLSYGFSLASPSFVLERFVQPFSWQLIGYHEKGWDKRQDVICLRKN
jgi:hypothetical protein